MRLTMTMFFGKKPHGYKYRGKHRVIKPILPRELTAVRQDFERTENNMLILRHPYLTVEQSKGHMETNKGYRYANFLTRVKEMQREKFSKSVTLAERLAHLKVKDAWD